jgi:hypothetical protein
MANTFSSRVCAPIIPTYRSYVFGTVGQQEAANTVFQNLASTVNSATNGTLGNAANGQPIFKSQQDRLLFLQGKINQLRCYTSRPATALDPN